MKAKLNHLSRHPEAPAQSKSRKDWRQLAADALPHSLWLGFVLVILLLFGDRLLPAETVVVETVVSLSNSKPIEAAEGEPAGGPVSWSGEMLFQASGWIEADPYPIRATALVSGVVDEVFVLEGETVEQGQLLATLIVEDTELELRMKQSRLDEMLAHLVFDEAEVKKSEARFTALGKEVVAAKARETEAMDLADRLEAAGAGAFTQQELTAARLRAETMAAETEAVRARLAEARADIAKAKAELMQAEARASMAQVEVDVAQLAVDRTRVYAPVDGVVQSLYASPGMKRMLDMDDPDSATICILYHPDQLQARIDVALDDAAGLFIGQPVRVLSSFLPDTVFKGEVSRIVGEADLQRNTLQVKVRILKPDPRLRPDFLCRAEFLGESSTGAEATYLNANRSIQLFVPREAVIAGIEGDTSAHVWRLDSSGERVERREVELGLEMREGHVAVTSGLQPGDRIVLNPTANLKSGQRVRF